MKENDSLSIILPVFNERAVLENIISSICAEVRLYVNEYEIIAVDDGSSDGSTELLEALSGKTASLKLLKNKSNLGYGSAIRMGILAAGNKHTLIMDADGQMDIGDFKGFWDIRDSFDFILGYRRERNDPPLRKILGKTGNFLTNLSLVRGRGLMENIKDINCAFKLFETKSLKELRLNSTGTLIWFEILWNLKNSGRKLRFAQVPVSHRPRRHGKATGGSFLTIATIITEAALLYCRLARSSKNKRR